MPSWRCRAGSARSTSWPRSSPGRCWACTTSPSACSTRPASTSGCSPTSTTSPRRDSCGRPTGPGSGPSTTSGRWPTPCSGRSTSATEAAGQELLAELELLDRHVAVAPRVHVQVLVVGPERLVELERGGEGEQLVVPLDEEQDRTGDLGGVRLDPGPGGAGHPHEAEDGHREARLGGHQRQAEDRAHREPPVPGRAAAHLLEALQRVEGGPPVLDHEVGHGRLGGPHGGELEEGQPGHAPLVGPTVAVHRAVDRGRRVPPVRDQASGQRHHVPLTLGPRGAVADQDEGPRPRRAGGGPQEAGDGPPGDVELEVALAHALGDRLGDEAHAGAYGLSTHPAGSPAGAGLGRPFRPSAPPRIGSWSRSGSVGYSAASASASARVGWTSMLSTMSVTRRPAVTATARTEMSSAAFWPTMDPPRTTPVLGSEMILTKPRGSLLMRARAEAAKGTLVTRILRPSAKASASASPTSAISGSVKMADAAFS